MRVAKTGNEAVAEAMRQINPDVVAAYPITPSSEIIQIFSDFVANGVVDTEFKTTESEHSAMSVCIGAIAAGARTMTATASQGLALMWEMLYITSGLRLPIVLAVVNRTLSAPINIHCDHSDSMGARDSGWVQIHSENAQEAYDGIIQAIRIAEGLHLPVMVAMDGFITSHCMEAIEMLQDEQVQNFTGTYKPKHSLLDIENPITMGAIDFTDYFFEHKRQTIEAMCQAKKVILDVAGEFKSCFGRAYGLFEEYRLDDAELAIVAIGSTCGTAKVVIDQLRNKGIKAGMLKLRVFRPFPANEIGEALSGVRALAVMDRCDGMNATGGPLFTEIRSALYDLKERPLVSGYVYGLGGRDTDLEQIKSVFKDLTEIAMTGKIKEETIYLGVRG